MTINGDLEGFQNFNFLKKLGYQLLVESIKIESTTFSYKIEWGVQNGTFTNKGVLPLTNFLKI